MQRYLHSKSKSGVGTTQKQKQKRNHKSSRSRLVGILSLVAVAIIVSLSSTFIAAAITTPVFAQAHAQAQAQAQPLAPQTTPNETGAEIVPLPTPTAPAWSRPNLHFYFFSEQQQPLSGVKVAIYQASYNAATKKQEVRLVLSGASDAQGRVSFDVTRLMPTIYFLELREADGSLVLPKDPDLFVPGQSVGQPQQNPALTYLTGLDLNYGSVVYVKHYQLRPLLKPFEATPTAMATLEPASSSVPTVSPSLLVRAKRAIYWPQVKQYIYYPPAGTDLASVGNSNSNSSNPNPPGQATGSPGVAAQTTIASAPNQSPVPSSNSNSSLVPGGGVSIVRPGIGGIPATPPQPQSSAINATGLIPVPASTSTPLPTATPLECRNCLSPGTGGSPDNSATLTARARSEVDAGRGGSSRLTPTPIPPGVLTQRAEAASRRTATAQAGLTVSSETSTTAPVPTTNGVTEPTTTVAATTAIATSTSAESGNNSIILPTPALIVEANLGGDSTGNNNPPTGTGAAPTNPTNSPTNSNAGDSGLLLIILGVIVGVALVGGGSYVGWHWHSYQRFPWD